MQHKSLLTQSALRDKILFSIRQKAHILTSFVFPSRQFRQILVYAVADLSFWDNSADFPQMPSLYINCSKHLQAATLRSRFCWYDMVFQCCSFLISLFIYVAGTVKSKNPNPFSSRTFCFSEHFIKIVSAGKNIFFALQNLDVHFNAIFNWHFHPVCRKLHDGIVCCSTTFAKLSVTYNIQVWY